jgi:hypothetical protein
MSSDKLDLTPFVRREGEVLLAKDVLDNQLIDVDGKRVVRVNDVQLIDVGDFWRVTGADVSLPGFCSSSYAERLLWKPASGRGPRLGGRRLSRDRHRNRYVQLKSSKDKLSRLHPVEIAQLAETLSPDTSNRSRRESRQ